MPKVELSEEAIKFMNELANEMKTQDNRATASPYYYVVMAKRELVAPAGYGDGDYVYYNSDWGEAHSKEEWVPILKQHDEDAFPYEDRVTDVDDFIRDCDEFSLHKIDTEENVFFTYKGYEQHMALNGHNYRHLDDVHSYIKYAGRNPEMEALHKVIMEFADIKVVSEEEV